MENLFKEMGKKCFLNVYLLYEGKIKASKEKKKKINIFALIY